MSLLLKITAYLIAIFFLARNFEWSLVPNIATSLTPNTILFSALFILFKFYFLAVRFFYIGRLFKSSDRLSVYSTNKIYAESIPLSCFTAGGVGGDLFKISELKRAGFSYRNSFAVCAIEKFTGLFSLGVLALPFLLKEFNIIFSMHNNVQMYLISALCVLFGLTLKFKDIALSSIVRIFDHPEIGILRAKGGLFPVILCSFLAQTGFMMSLALIFYDVAGIPFLTSLAIAPLFIISTALPISVAGFGPRELLAVYFMGSTYGPEEVLVASTMFGSILLFVGAFIFIAMQLLKLLKLV